MIKGQLKNGFKFKVDEKDLNDMRLVDALAEMEGDPTKLSQVVLMIFGKEQRDRLYKVLEDEKGRVPVDEISKCIEEALNASGDAGKN